ncbi:MAG: hypothetical protein PHU85_11215 [Phycisphaerae bacterium]|nr:hypothetical protein [Phycisphaerae bacterium]
MSLDAPWVWLGAVLVGWVFLGLVAGRFSVLRNRLESPGGAKPADGRRSAMVTPP